MVVKTRNRSPARATSAFDRKPGFTYTSVMARGNRIVALLLMEAKSVRTDRTDRPWAREKTLEGSRGRGE